MLIPFVLSALLADATLDSARAAGQLAYHTRCAACHGEDLRGSDAAPSLRGVGAADLDFWMVTGRMPAAVPWIEVGHRGQQISTGEIRAIETYVTDVAPGGPAIPEVATSRDVAYGRELFTLNCQQCHGVDAEGASIGGGGAWAPSLHAASIVQVAEAIRVGPGNMPKFAPSQLDAPALDALATYVFSLDSAATTNVFPLNSGGPVPEGLYGWLAVGFLALLTYAFSKRSGSPDGLASQATDFAPDDRSAPGKSSAPGLSTARPAPTLQERKHR